MITRTDQEAVDKEGFDLFDFHGLGFLSPTLSHVGEGTSALFPIWILENAPAWHHPHIQYQFLTARPLASRVTLMPAGAIARWRYMAVASPSRLVLVATITSVDCLIGGCRLGVARRSSLILRSEAAIPDVGEMAPCRTW